MYDNLFNRKLEYTRETLLEFKKEMAEKAAAAKNQGDGGFGGFGTQKKTEKKEASFHYF